MAQDVCVIVGAEDWDKSVYTIAEDTAGSAEAKFIPMLEWE